MTKEKKLDRKHQFWNKATQSSPLWYTDQYSSIPNPWIDNIIKYNKAFNAKPPALGEGMKSIKIPLSSPSSSWKERLGKGQIEVKKTSGPKRDRFHPLWQVDIPLNHPKSLESLLQLRRWWSLTCSHLKKNLQTLAFRPRKAKRSLGASSVTTRKGTVCWIP